MAYPTSSDVSAGQKTYATHYNYLRRDAVYLGQSELDALDLGTFFSRYARNLTLVYAATNRVKIIFDTNRPPRIVIGGCMLNRGTTVYTATGALTGLGAAIYYVIATRSVGSTTFTLSFDASALDSDMQRTIGYIYWDGSNITSIQSYFGNLIGFPEPSYDSGWFAVTTGTVYTKTHGLGAVPRAYALLHSTNSTGSVENVAVITVKPTSVNYYYGNVGFDSSNAYVETSTDASAGVVASVRRLSATGYYRLMVWY
jgi:hypothetical protein